MTETISSSVTATVNMVGEIKPQWLGVYRAYFEYLSEEKDIQYPDALEMAARLTRSEMDYALGLPTAIEPNEVMKPLKDLRGVWSDVLLREVTGPGPTPDESLIKRTLQQVLAEPLAEDELSAFTSLVGADCIVDDEGIMFASAQAVAWAIADWLIDDDRGQFYAGLLRRELEAAGYKRPEGEQNDVS